MYFLFSRSQEDFSLGKLFFFENLFLVYGQAKRDHIINSLYTFIQRGLANKKLVMQLIGEKNLSKHS